MKDPCCFAHDVGDLPCAWTWSRVRLLVRLNSACSCGWNLQVDLGAPVEVGAVVVLNRQDCCRERILNGSLSLLAHSWRRPQQLSLDNDEGTGGLPSVGRSTGPWESYGDDGIVDPGGEGDRSTGSSSGSSSPLSKLARVTAEVLRSNSTKARRAREVQRAHDRRGTHTWAPLVPLALSSVATCGVVLFGHGYPCKETCTPHTFPPGWQNHATFAPND
jgi:hypothetical protein